MSVVHSWTGPVTTRWNDYVGTAAADDAAVTVGQRSLYELAGIDRDLWTILGLDVNLRLPELDVTLFVARRHVARDIEDLRDPQGRLPVTAIRLVGAEHIERFVNEAFANVSVRLMSSPYRDENLLVEETILVGDGQPPHPTP